MCGRLACRLTKNRMRRSCTYKPASSPGDGVIPEWLDVNSCGNYAPSYNIGPTVHTPVLTECHHWVSRGYSDLCGERVLIPMSWGLVPSWHKGDPKEFGLKTINCRLEGILEKPTFKTPLTKGQRCVVLAEGFFEWKTEKGTKQPYYVYFPQPKEVNMSTRNWEKDPEDEESTSPRLLTMAGIFEVITLPDREKFLSYTIITKNALPSLSWLHSRMPAILDGDECIQKWLDNKNVSFEEALNLLDGPVDLEWHPVSTAVGNVRNSGVECVLPAKIAGKSSKSITDWFKPASMKKQAPENVPSAKKLKTEM